MRSRRRTPYFLTFIIAWICFGIVGFLAGYYLHPLFNSDTPEIAIDENEKLPYNDYLHLDEYKENTESEPSDTPVTSYEDSIGTDTKVVFRTLFTSCQSIRDDVIEPLEEIIGLKEGGFRSFAEANFTDWQIVRFSKDEVILFRRKEQICPNHFFVSEQDGFIAIFRFNEAGERILIEKTSLPISVLPAIDQEKLKRGILLNTRDEVNSLLEDYSS
ncbi:BofC C-terminal domain-containing protein [Alkaliphilus peptidifermentans]|uniref:BofC C-terminal domain-containing protein n=1 Tax=Alkaliphilus peptidifermentans DSM 18978 TaxID=1120976 RepID=A0A1G5L4W7_9FIRM|nr:BofC C-terminal domain-containing protein [Alkaliphilus peptidifermentans]SCZ07408.1 BofC C-terminal domain-containing protein [Alkaliphilus peptidifermentans DSM 18978]